MNRITVALTTGILLSASVVVLFAQSTRDAALPSFDVISVKPNNSDQPPKFNFPLGPGDVYMTNGGHFIASNLPLATYLSFAYKLLGTELQSVSAQLPSWATSDKFDIEARTDGDPAKDAKNSMRLMMRSLLAERFGLKTHYETREIPVFGVSQLKAGNFGPQLQQQPVLVFADGARVMGLMVDEIVDVVEDYLQVELATDQPGFLGTAIIQGRATDILDTSFWLKCAFKDWFGTNPMNKAEPRQLLVVEDSAFFRSLIVPALSAEGYVVTAVDNPVAALALRTAGRGFDLILSDIEMPEMDGLEFAREIRARGAWMDLPVIALSSLSSPKAMAIGREAGFDNYISKFDKAILVEAVANALATSRAGSAPRRVLADAGARA